MAELRETSCIIMASGFSKRMKKNKLFLSYRGTTFLNQALETAEAANFLEVILVIRPEDAEKVQLPPRIKQIMNHEAKAGQSVSVKLGAIQAKGKNLLFMPIDQPLLTPEILKKIVAAGEKDKIVFPLYQKAPTTPIFFGEKFKAELLKTTGSVGGRKIRDRYPENGISLTLETEELLKDIDTPKSYQELLEKSK